MKAESIYCKFLASQQKAAAQARGDRDKRLVELEKCELLSQEIMMHLYLKIAAQY